MRRLRRTYIGGRKLRRKEAREALEHLSQGRSVLISGAAGSGKSVIAGQVTQLARRAGWSVLVLSVDRLPDADTAYALGAALGLPDSPPTVLAGASAGRDALLVLDQLDAVSVASGRHPERLGIVEDLLTQADSHPRLRVLLACRQFDLDNDRELRSVAASKHTAIVPAGALDPATVREALVAVDLSSDLPPDLIELLTVPLHLAIYVELGHAGVSDMARIRTLTELYDRYWVEKREACRLLRSGTDEWLAVIDRLVDRMSADQKLAIPAAVLDDIDKQVSVMASEAVLVSDGGRISLFHETFFDYCFARRFVAAGRNLRGLLGTEEQDLFRRAQVRQILTYERGTAFETYLADLNWLLTASDVRQHIKALVVALAQTVTNPQRDEWLALRPIATAQDHPLHGRLWQALRSNPAWFPLLHQDGAWAAWLGSPDGPITDQALWALTGMASTHPEETSALLRGMRRDEAWLNRLRGFLRLAGIHSGRALFDLLLEGVQDGLFDNDPGRDLWHVIRELADNQPEWAVEVLDALFVRALAGDAGNPFEGEGALTAGPNSPSIEAAQAVAQAAPGAFVMHLLPHALEIARRNAQPEWSGGDVLLDTVWGVHFFGAHSQLKDAFHIAMGDALRAVAQTEPDLAGTVFERLRADPHETAWFLLARGYEANPDRFADDAAGWLTNTPGAMHLGYSDEPHWVSRELIAAITPRCSDAKLDLLTAALIGYAPPFERTYEGLRHRGYGELCLLNAIDPGRRSEGVEKRLGELRRKFLIDDVEPPQGIRGGIVPPPIPEERARKMTDRQWLRAMARHGRSDVRFRQDGGLIGDAGTQAQVLEAVTRDSSERFARLLLQLPSEIAEPYVGGILRGLAGSRLDVDLLLSVCQRAREIGGSDTNRWVVRLIEAEAAATLRDDFLDIVAEIATVDPDPADDVWRSADPGATPLYGGDPDSAGLNCTRGAAALAIAALIQQDPGRLPPLADALAQVATDRTLQVRAVASVALTTVLYVDPTLALALFGRSLADATDELLASHHVERFLNHAIRRGHYAETADALTRMSSSTNPDARRAGARQLAVASYRDPALDDAVDAALSGEESTRSGVTEVFAENIHDSDRMDRAIAVLSQSFNDPSPGVRSAAVRCFYGLEEQTLEDYEPLLAALADSPALHEDPGTVFQSLESARKPLPKSVLNLCEGFVEAHGASLSDISTAAAADATHVVQLAIRLHAQHADPETRRRCLDLIDRLVVLGVYGIDQNLALIER